MNEKVLSPEFVERRVRSIAKLSTLPFIAIKVMELVENPRTSASRLCDLISADQVLAARILKLANSAYYGFPRKISTLNLAIVVLGFNALRDLVLSISVIDQFNVDQESNLHLEQFWRHALIVGRGARLLARYLNYPVIGEVFVAGLLHDIGYLVLLQQFPDNFKLAYDYAKEKEISFNEAEVVKLGYSHSVLGAWLAEGWNLPGKLVQAIRYHHSPEKSFQNKELVNIIYLSDLLSYSIDVGSGFNGLKNGSVPNIENIIKEMFPRNRYPVSFYQDKFREESEKIQDFLNILKNRS